MKDLYANSGVHAQSVAVLLQESKERQALWVVPHSMADIEDEVVRTVQSRIMTDRGVDVRRDLQVLASCRPQPLQIVRDISQDHKSLICSTRDFDSRQ